MKKSMVLLNSSMDIGEELKERIKEVKPFHLLRNEKLPVTGYHIVFKNNWLISIQFGPGNYCDNYHESFDVSPFANLPDNKYSKSTTAEIAYWKVDNKGQHTPMQMFDNGDTVLGYQTFDQVVEWMNIINQKKA